MRRLGGTRNFAKWWWLRRGWASQHTSSNGFFDVHIMLIARRERLEMLVLITFFLSHLQMNLICLRNHLFSILRLHFYCHPTGDHSSWPYSKKEIMITMRTMSHHLLGDPVCDLKDLPPLRLQDGRGFSIVLCRGAISIRLGPRHTSMAKDVGVDVFFVSPRADQPSQGNKTADEYVVSSQWKAWNSNDLFFVILKHCQRNMMFFRIFHLVRNNNPSRIEWDLPNGPLSKLLELLDTHV